MDNSKIINTIIETLNLLTDSLKEFEKRDRSETEKEDKLLVLLNKIALDVAEIKQAII